MWAKIILMELEQSDAGKMAAELMARYDKIIESRRKRGFSAVAIARFVIELEAGRVLRGE